MYVIQSVSATAAGACTFPPEEHFNGILCEDTTTACSDWLAMRGGNVLPRMSAGVPPMGGRTGGRGKRYGKCYVRAVSM